MANTCVQGYSGPWIENLAIEFFRDQGPLPRVYIPVPWKDCYRWGKAKEAQAVLNSLDPNYRYFTITQVYS